MFNIDALYIYIQTMFVLSAALDHPPAPWPSLIAPSLAIEQPRRVFFITRPFFLAFRFRSGHPPRGH